MPSINKISEFKNKIKLKFKKKTELDNTVPLGIKKPKINVSTDCD